MIAKKTKEMKEDLKKYGLGLKPLISKENFIKKWGMSPGYMILMYNDKTKTINKPI